MRKLHILFIILSALLLGGCALNPSAQWENEQIEYYKQLESNKNYYQLANETYMNLEYPSKKMGEYIIPVWQSEEFGKAVIAGVISDQNTITEFKESNRLKHILKELNKQNKFIGAEALECLKQMDDILKHRIENKKLKILMNQLPSEYNEKKVKNAAYYFSIEQLKSTADMSLFDSVVDYVYENKNMTNTFKKDIQKIKVRKAMLDNTKLRKILTTDYNKFKNRIPQLCVFFDKNDKLMGLDVCSVLNRDQRFILTNKPNNSITRVSVERLAFDVQSPTVDKRTVTINQVDVDLLKAALLMPRNAIYQFETVTRTAGVSYAYMITTEKNGKKYEDLLRKNYTQNSTSCENMRVQNVFGGVQAANWYPNQYVQNMCSSSTAPILSYEEMKRNIAEDIASNILTTLEKYNLIQKNSINTSDPGWLE